MNPYATLGVDQDADAAMIRRAYYRLARRHHPDHGGSTARMREINAAYGVLMASARHATCDPPGRPDARTSAPPRATRTPSSRTSRSYALAARTAVWAWMRGARPGQWAVSVAIVLAVHEVASWATPHGSFGALEALTMILALRLQASATPPGHTFAPARDVSGATLTALRIVGWIASR
jgi:hypothetical protein